jgi:hypothetical protein
MLVTSAAVGATGSARAGAELTELTLRRTPSLLIVGARATLGTGPRAAQAQAVFRDELLGVLDEAAEIAWRQARRARDQLGLRTAPRDEVLPDAARANGTAPRRHRVKA